MSPDNVEIVLEGMRRFAAVDVDGAATLWHRDSRVTGPDGWPEPGPFEGREAVIGQFRRLAGWGENVISDIEILVERGDWVVLKFSWGVRGGQSDAPTAASFAAAYRVTEGLIKEAHFRWTPGQVLEAAGLSE